MDTAGDGTPEARRTELIEKFAHWLDEVLEQEAPPKGVAAELLQALEGVPLEESPQACSDYELWTAMNALSQEVKLQGRAFRDLSEALADQEKSEDFAPLEKAISAFEASRKDVERIVAAQASDAAWREILDLLLDLRDRLCRSEESMQSTRIQLEQDLKKRRFFRFFPRRNKDNEHFLSLLEALAQGNTLVREGLDESLARLAIHEIPTTGRAFDPAAMKVVEVELRDDLPEGSICGVHRRGYTWRGEVIRPVEVKVTRSKAANRGASES